MTASQSTCDALDQIERTLCASEPCPFFLGAGFSHPFQPTTEELVYRLLRFKNLLSDPSAVRMAKRPFPEVVDWIYAREHPRPSAKAARDFSDHLALAFLP